MTPAARLYRDDVLTDPMDWLFWDDDEAACTSAAPKPLRQNGLTKANRALAAKARRDTGRGA